MAEVRIFLQINESFDFDKIAKGKTSKYISVLIKLHVNDFDEDVVRLQISDFNEFRKPKGLYAHRWNIVGYWQNQ